MISGSASACAVAAALAVSGILLSGIFNRYVDARTATFPGNENDLLELIGNLVGHRLPSPLKCPLEMPAVRSMLAASNPATNVIRSFDQFARAKS